MIIDKIAGKEGEIDLSGKTVHIAEFTEEQMAKGHQRFAATDGFEAAISLESGVRMEDGDMLCAGETDYILVRAAVEEVFVLSPEGKKDWGKTCYNIGNMHKKAYFCGEEILVPYDAVLEPLLKKLNANYRVERRRITGERANISAGEHAHLHGHAHAHEHAHGDTYAHGDAHAHGHGRE